jgi:predicted transposase/invertase (TIGR01784 family)
MTEGLLKPSSDFVFANMFGVEKHKRALICLLNAILRGKPAIKSITLLNPQHQKQRKDGKSTTLDIEAITDDDTIVDIEVQCRRDGNLVTRAMYHQARMMRDELNESESYDSCPDIISIWFTNYDETHRKYHTHESVHTFKANSLDGQAVSSEKSRIFIIELPKFNLKEASLNDMFSVWMFFLKNPELIPDEFVQKVPEVHEALEELKVMSLDEKFRAAYRAHVKAENDRRSREANARIEGEEKGRAEGRAEEKKKTALKLLEKGMSVADIAEITNLSVEEIRALAR